MEGNPGESEHICYICRNFYASACGDIPASLWVCSIAPAPRTASVPLGLGPKQLLRDIMFERL